MNRIVPTALLLVLVAGACGADDGSFDPPAPTSSVPDSIERADIDVPAGSTPRNTVPGRFDPAAQPLESDADLDGEVPDDIIAMVLADAGATETEVVVARREVWSDGSLGCPEPGVLYTQAIVDGYQVIITGPDGDHDYRISDNGYFIICTQND